MNNSIDRIQLIDRKALDEESYFLSLMGQAHDKGLLQPSDLERIQYECLELLARKTELYQSGDSSIKVETAQSIMASNLLTIGLCLKTYPCPDDAVAVLLDEGIPEIYQRGRKQIDVMVADAKIIHGQLTHRLFDTKNCFYRSTIIDGINGFFKLYYPDYSAQEIHITADYPTYNRLPPVEGIEFITKYLEALSYENQFCRYFDAKDIHYLLSGYEIVYQELLINMYGLVLLTAVGCVLAGTEVVELDITGAGIVQLEKRLSGMSHEELAKTVCQATEEVAELFNCPKGLAEYMQESASLMIKDLELAKDGCRLGSVFFLPEVPIISMP